MWAGHWAGGPSRIWYMDTWAPAEHCLLAQSAAASSLDTATRAAHLPCPAS